MAADREAVYRGCPEQGTCSHGYDLNDMATNKLGSGDITASSTGTWSTVLAICDPLLQVGHLKTIIILTGGCMFFGDQMPPKKLLGVAVAMVRPRRGHPHRCRCASSLM
jgi:hypothetical protein